MPFEVFARAATSSVLFYVSPLVLAAVGACLATGGRTRCTRRHLASLGATLLIGSGLFLVAANDTPTFDLDLGRQEAAKQGLRTSAWSEPVAGVSVVARIDRATGTMVGIETLWHHPTRSSFRYLATLGGLLIGASIVQIRFGAPGGIARLQV